MQLEIIRISREVGVTVIYVTHDQEEALAMSDRIAIYSAGRIEQVGTGADLYERPASLFVADFVGDSTVFRGTLETRGGRTFISSSSYSLPVSAEACRQAGLADGASAAVVVRPECLEVDLYDAAGRPSDHAEVGPGTITEDLYLGANRKLVVDFAGGVRAVARFTNGAPAPEGLRAGAQVCVHWPVERGIVVGDDHYRAPAAHPGQSATAGPHAAVRADALVETPC
jgi:putative spermidine/putrescine transport system ATP-binding protein